MTCQQAAWPARQPLRRRAERDAQSVHIRVAAQVLHAAGQASVTLGSPRCCCGLNHASRRAPAFRRGGQRHTGPMRPARAALLARDTVAERTVARSPDRDGVQLARQRVRRRPGGVRAADPAVRRRAGGAGCGVRPQEGRRLRQERPGQRGQAAGCQDLRRPAGVFGQHHSAATRHSGASAEVSATLATSGGPSRRGGTTSCDAAALDTRNAGRSAPPSAPARRGALLAARGAGFLSTRG